MEKPFKKTAAWSLEEALKRLKVSDGTKFPASLFCSKKSGQVLYLEAGKDFMDTLLSFLLLPVGTIHHMLTTGIQVKPALGGISRIFESVQNFSASDLLLAKENLVQPRPASIDCACKSCDLPMQVALEKALILPSPRDRPGFIGEYYECSSCNNLANSTWKNLDCFSCKSSGYTCHTYTEGPYSVFKEPDYYTGGFVKENTLFIITDSLEIMPLTTIRSVSVLIRLKIASLADLEGNNITVSLRQILQLLHSSLRSNTCLNDVFGTSK